MRKLESAAGGATNGVFNELRRVRGPVGLGVEDLAALVTAAADGITVLDSNRRIVYANPAACKQLGYPLKQLVGVDGLMLVPESERQTVLAVLTNAARGQRHAIEGVAWRSDGSELDVEVTTSALDLGSNRYVVVATRDVTERRRQARQAAALAQAAASVVLSDSIEATVEAIAECALRGTQALAAWVLLDNEDRVGAWLGAAGVPDGFREQFGPDACARARYIFRDALIAHRVVIYADARQ